MRVYFIIFCCLFATIGMLLVYLKTKEQHDRSTPAKTFEAMRQGLERGQYDQVVESFSEQQKRFYLFETLFAAGMTQGEEKRQIDELFQKYGLDVSEMHSAVNDRNAWFDKICDDLSGNIGPFLIDIRQIIGATSGGGIEPELVSVSISGERAVVRYKEFISGEYGGAGDSEMKEFRQTFETELFMRKYGEVWLICPKGEWNDPTYTWTIPN